MARVQDSRIFVRLLKMIGPLLSPRILKAFPDKTMLSVAIVILRMISPMTVINIGIMMLVPVHTQLMTKIHGSSASTSSLCGLAVYKDRVLPGETTWNNETRSLGLRQSRFQAWELQGSWCESCQKCNSTRRRFGKNSSSVIAQR